MTNSGTVSGTTYGIWTDNNSNITSLHNTSTGLITGGAGFLAGNNTPSGTITVGTLTNEGVILGTTGVAVGTSTNGTNGTIGSLVNSGVISGAAGGIGNAGRIGSVINTGTITSGSGYAIYNAGTGSIGPIANSGLVSGTIYNGATASLTINGGSGSTFGTITGANGGISSADVGDIYSTSANLYLASGNLLLNSNVHTNNYTITNSGATLQVNNHISIDGRYSQGASATLLIGVGDTAVSNGVTADTGYGRLTVSGSAIIASGSSVTLKALNSYGFAIGQRYVVVQAATNNTNYNASTLNYSAIGYSGTVSGSVVVDGSTSNLLLTLGSSSSGGGSGSGSSSGSSSGNTGPNISATTSNAVSAISGLFNYSGVNTSLLNVFNASAALGSTAESNRAGAQLSPASNALATVQASAAPTQSVLNVAGAHVDGLRIAQVNGGSGVATGEAANNVALWGQAFGGKATQGQRDNVSGYSANYNGLLIGGGYRSQTADVRLRYQF